MSIIDRYVIRQILVPFLLGLLVFTFIFIIPELMRIAEDLVAKGVDAAVVAHLAFLLIPYALSLTIPMSLLLGLLVGFGRLSADREFVAMQACGVSLLRLLRPVGVIALGGWAATSYVLIVAVPDANQAFRQIAFDVTARRAEGEVKPRVFYDQFPNLVLYAREVPPAGSGWQGVFLADVRVPERAEVFLAERGRVVVDRASQRIDMVLEHGTQHRTDGSGQYDVSKFRQLILGVNPAGVLSMAVPKGLNEMTIAELRASIAEKEGTIDPETAAPYPTHNERMAIHQKFSIPVACLVFGLIGLALGATHRRDGMLGSFVIGIVVIFAYYVPLYLGPQMVKAGMLPVWLGKWLPNVVLGVLGLMMFVWRDRVADQPITLTVPAWMKRLASAAPLPGLGMLRVLDRYVTTSYLRILALTAAGLLGIFYITTFLDLSDKVLKGSVTWGMLGEYFWFATPQWLYYVVPLSILLAVLVTIAILTKNSELIVMKACGISLYRIALPMIVTAGLAGALLFAMEETLLGSSNRRAEELRHVIRGGSAETFDVLHHGWLVGSEGQMYSYIWFDPRNGLLSGLSIYEFAGQMERLTRRSYVELATYRGPLEEDPLHVWKVERGWTREFDENDEVLSFEPFTADTRHLEPPDFFGADQPRPEFMGYTELREHTAQLAASGYDTVAQEVALARKLAFPFVPIVMTLLAVPFAVTIGRSGAMGGIGVGIALAMIYWGVISVFAALGTGGALPPVLAAWAPNLLFGSAAAYLLLTVRT